MSASVNSSLDIWSRIVDLSDSLVTVFVAIIVAIIATRRETNKQLAQRHFDFRDERADIYAELIAKMNKAIGLYLGCESATHYLTKQETGAADIAALDFETATLRAQIQVPEYVAHACLSINGRIQTLIAQLGAPNGIGMQEMEFDSAKNNMLKVMKIDIRLIEKTSNRTAYSKLVDSENTRYFSEMNIPEPSK